MSVEGLSGTTTPASSSAGADGGNSAFAVNGVRALVIALLIIGTFLFFAGAHYGLRDPQGNGYGHGVFYLASLFVPTVIALFGIYWIRGLIRDALAVSIFVAYFAMLFNQFVFAYTNEVNRSDALVTNFTQLTGIVAVFYFGSVGAVEVAKVVWGPKPPPSSQGQTPPATDASGTGPATPPTTPATTPPAPTPAVGS